MLPGELLSNYLYIPLILCCNINGVPHDTLTQTTFYCEIVTLINIENLTWSEAELNNEILYNKG